MPSIMGALRERIREGPPSLADVHKAYDKQCREELEKIDREVVEIPVDLSKASPGSLNTASLRDTWPGPYMKDRDTGHYIFSPAERELWALVEGLVNLAMDHQGSTGEDDWSDFTSPFQARPRTGWRAEAWNAYFSGEFD